MTRAVLPPTSSLHHTWSRCYRRRIAAVCNTLDTPVAAEAACARLRAIRRYCCRRPAVDYVSVSRCVSTLRNTMSWLRSASCIIFGYTPRHAPHLPPQPLPCELSSQQTPMTLWAPRRARSRRWAAMRKSTTGVHRRGEVAWHTSRVWGGSVATHPNNSLWLLASNSGAKHQAP
jgi:hypothetical protein